MCVREGMTEQVAQLLEEQCVDKIIQIMRRGRWQQAATVLAVLNKATENLVESICGEGGVEGDLAVLTLITEGHIWAKIVHIDCVLDVFKRALLGDSTLLNTAANALVKGCTTEILFGEWLWKNGLFDYVVEMLRGGDLEKQIAGVRVLETMLLVKPTDSMHVIWAYSLSIVVDACVTVLLEHNHVQKSAVSVLVSALTHAALASLTDDVIRIVTTGIMALMSKDTSLFETGVGALANFVERGGGEGVWGDLVGVCEIAVIKGGVSGVQLLAALMGNAKGGEGGARRLLELGYGKVAERVGRHGWDDEKDAIAVLSMMERGLRAAFVQNGVWFEGEWKQIRDWCWKTIPPKHVFEFCDQMLGFDVESCTMRKEIETVAVRYLWRITKGTEYDRESDLEGVVPTTEIAFLEGLVEEGCRGEYNRNMLDTALKIGVENTICATEKIIQVLCGCVRSAYQQDALTDRWDRVIIDVRRICHLLHCTQTKLDFDSVNILPKSILLQILEDSRFNISDVENATIFKHVVCRYTTEKVGTTAWVRYCKEVQSGSINRIAQMQFVVQTISENSNAAECLLFALSTSSHFHEIAELVLDVMCEDQTTSTLIIQALENAGVLQVLSDAFQATEVALDDIEFVITQSGENEQSGRQHILRLHCLVLLLTCKRASRVLLSDCNVLRKVCELTERVPLCSLVKPRVVLFCMSLVRWIIACTHDLEENHPCWLLLINSKARHAITKWFCKLALTPEQWNQDQEKFLSLMACFHSVLFHRDGALMSEMIHHFDQLRNMKMWENLLCYTSSLFGTCSARISSCCHLLSVIVERGTIITKSIITSRIMILISVAGASCDLLLRDAAFTLLTTLTEKIFRANECTQEVFAVHQALSNSLLQKLDRLGESGLTPVEVRYCQSVERWRKGQKLNKAGQNVPGSYSVSKYVVRFGRSDVSLFPHFESNRVDV